MHRKAIPSNESRPGALRKGGQCACLLRKQMIARKDKKLTGSILMPCDQPLYLNEGTNIRSKLTYRIIYRRKEAFCCGVFVNVEMLLLGFFPF
ncbi:hypothetical protein E2320_001212 [Naja naja]|nr:hypothetical protein E2320_001212 [Naja naja]